MLLPPLLLIPPAATDDRRVLKVILRFSWLSRRVDGLPRNSFEKLLVGLGKHKKQNMTGKINEDIRRPRVRTYAVRPSTANCQIIRRKTILNLVLDSSAPITVPKI